MWDWSLHSGLHTPFALLVELYPLALLIITMNVGSLEEIPKADNHFHGTCWCALTICFKRLCKQTPSLFCHESENLPMCAPVLCPPFLLFNSGEVPLCSGSYPIYFLGDWALTIASNSWLSLSPALPDSQAMCLQVWSLRWDSCLSPVPSSASLLAKVRRSPICSCCSTSSHHILSSSHTGRVTVMATGELSAPKVKSPSVHFDFLDFSTAHGWPLSVLSSSF
jgi:hypothetical protein